MWIELENLLINAGKAGLIYGKNLLIAFDQLCNTAAGGEPDETFSSRCWRLHHRWPWKLLRCLVDAVFFWDAKHCYTSFIAECNGGHLPPEVRGAV